jgi:hypothetical protein
MMRKKKEKKVMIDADVSNCHVIQGCLIIYYLNPQELCQNPKLQRHILGFKSDRCLYCATKEHLTQVFNFFLFLVFVNLQIYTIKIFKE